MTKVAALLQHAHHVKDKELHVNVQELETPL